MSVWNYPSKFDLNQFIDCTETLLDVAVARLGERRVGFGLFTVK